MLNNVTWYLIAARTADLLGCRAKAAAHRQTAHEIVLSDIQNLRGAKW